MLYMKVRTLSKSEVIKMERQYVSIGEAAVMLGVHQNTLRNWEKAGKINPARTLGNRRRYNIDELKKILAGE